MLQGFINHSHHYIIFPQADESQQEDGCLPDSDAVHIL